MKKEAKLQTTRTEHVYIAIGPHCWARADTPARARRYCALNKPWWFRERARYRVYLCPPSVRVCEPDGRLEWGVGDPTPVCISEKVPRSVLEK